MKEDNHSEAKPASENPHPEVVATAPDTLNPEENKTSGSAENRQAPPSGDHLESAESGEAVNVEVITEEADSAGEAEESGQKTEPPAPPSLETQLASATAQVAEYQDKLLRLQAEFENFKKRMARRQMEDLKYANEVMLESLIPVLDNFHAALDAVEQAGPNSLDSLRQGVSMVLNQLQNILKNSGMEEIDALGQPFDPNWHEAIKHQETEDQEEGMVLTQIRRGYKLRDRLIRGAQVIVTKAVSQSAPEAKSGEPGN